ncbi:MAG: glycoside hydrolase family 31 protein [Clostridium sp.]
MKRKMIMKRLSLLALSAFMVTNSIMTVNINAETIADTTSQEVVEGVAEAVEEYSHIGAVESFKTEGNIVTIKMVTGEQVRVSLLSDKVFRLYMDPTGTFQEDPTPNGEDHTTTIRAKADAEYEGVTPNVEDGDILKISTNSIELRVEKATGKMELINKETNKTMWKEAEPLKYKSNETIQTLETTSDEYFYGGGVQNGRFSHKGESINIVNENNWVDGGVASPTPFYWSTTGYGIMRNTFKPGQYDFASRGSGLVTTKHNEKRFDAYYFIDEKPNEIINGFYELTGKPLLMPEYAFYLGHLNCYSRDWINDETGESSQTPRPGFDRQETLMVDAKNVLDEHLDNDMPLGYFLPNDGYGCGYGRADTIDGNIENLKEFVDYTRGNGIQTGLWTQSSLKPTGNQEAYLERDIDKEVGVAGTNAVKTDVAWVGSGYSFALNSVRQAAEGIERNSKDKARPYVVAVDGWAGTQRYSTIWSGDQSGGDWEYIRFHIPTYIGSGLSGNPNIGSDMDGIFGGKKPVIQSRDFQWKAFTPIQLDMDGWGSNAKNPYVFDEPYTSINRMYLKLKSEMMPYIYSNANEATNNGMPMVRAMMLEYPNEYTYGTDTQYQYMWGENMLVAPIYQDTASDENGNDIRNDIYLPDEDQVWIDYFTGDQYRGGGVLNNFDAPVWKTPLFIKNGAIIPMSNENNTPERIDTSERKYEVYPSGETSFDVYEDDGLTTDYKTGKSATTKVTSVAPKTGKGKVVINAGLLTGSYEGIIEERTTEFVVNVSEKPSELALKVGGKDVALTEAKSLEEFNKGTNLYFYDEKPNLNKYATAGSDFEKTEITTTPKVYVKVDKTDVTKNEVELTINDFVNTQEGNKYELNTELSAPTNLAAPEELITPTTVDLTWDAVEGADSYEIDVDGMIFKNIKDTKYKKKGLEFDTVYNYRVRSLNKDGYSEWSEVVSTKTKLDPYTNVPKDMSIIWNEGHYGTDSPEKAVDNNDNSMFHSAGNAINKPVIVDMQKAYDIEFLDLSFRAGGNGAVKRADVYSSVDGVNYERIFSNTIDTPNAAWATDGKPKRIEFAKPIKARYFKIVAKESVSNFIAINEVRPVKVDGTIGKVVGDWNNSGAVEEGDLVFLQNYAGLSSVDADWDYVSAADLNNNKLIDAYDIAYVANQLEGGVEPTKNKIAGEVSLAPSKKDIKAGETFTVDVVGTALSDINAFSVEVPLDTTKYEFVKSEATEVSIEMMNLSKVRTHSDGSQAVYSIFNNVGNKSKISGTTPISTITLKSKADVIFDLEATHALLVDSKLNTRDSSDPYRNVPEGMTADWKLGNEMEFYPNNVLDGDDSTRFMSKDPNAIDEPFIVDMKEVYDIEQVDILCRDVDLGSGKGGVLRAELYGSVDGVNYEKIYSNTEETGLPVWVNEGKSNELKLDKPAKARYIKLVAKETVAGYLSIKEFRPIKVAETSEVVEIVVSKAKNLKANDVTNNSVKLTWDASETVAGLDEYIVYKDGKEFARVLSTETEVVVSDLRVNTNYGFKIAAKYSNDEVSKPVSVNVRTKKK